MFKFSIGSLLVVLVALQQNAVGQGIHVENWEKWMKEIGLEEVICCPETTGEDCITFDQVVAFVNQYSKIVTETITFDYYNTEKVCCADQVVSLADYNTIGLSPLFFQLRSFAFNVEYKALFFTVPQDTFDARSKISAENLKLLI